MRTDEGPDANAQMLLLDVTLNGTATRQLLTITRFPDGSLFARPSELSHLRIRVDPAAIHGDSVALSAIPGIAFRYDEASQAIALQVPDAALQAYQVALNDGRRPLDLDAIKPTPGAILNYGFYGLHGDGRTRLDGSAEFIGMSRLGVITANALFNTTRSYGGKSVLRLDTNWRHIDARAVRSYTIGDFASNALAWTSSVRLAGLQIASAFDQRSDIVTTALPQFSGSAALPSTLDLYVNQQRVFSGEIPSGPYDVKSLPQVSGGDVRLVTTDATGRQVEMTRSYYHVAGQLRKGLVEFSIDIGLPRRDYGVRSFRYDRTFFGSGSIRYGVTARTTVEGHAEASTDGLANLGAGIVQGIGGAGAITASVAASRYRSHTGAKFSAQGEGYLGGVRFYAGTERARGEYFDLARVSAVGNAHRTGVVDYTRFLANTAQARAIDRAGLSFIPWFDRTSVNLSYSAIKSAHYMQRIASVAVSRPITDRINLYASGYADLARRQSYGAFATANIRLGHTSVTTGVEHSVGRTAYSVQADGIAGRRQGDLGWGFSDREVHGGDDQRSAYVSYRAREAFARGRVEQSGNKWRVGVDVEGSMVAAGGGVFAANRIGDGFIVVKNAGPGAEVIQGGVRMGRADRAGRTLLAEVQPYYMQQIFIDPATLPDAWEPTVTERMVATSYRQGAIADFGATQVRGAVVMLHDRAGTPIPAGYVAKLEGAGDAVIGYDGETYVRGLRPDNQLSVDLGAYGTCTARFAYDVKGPPQPRIGPVACQ